MGADRQSAEVRMLMKAREDLLWMNSEGKSLKEKYNNRFVAISGSRVIGSDPDLETLLEKLRSKEIDPKEVLIKYITKTIQVL